MRPIITLTVLAIMAAMIFVSCESSGGGKSAIISGTVTTSDTAIFLSDVTVREDIPEGRSATTNENGYFIFKDTPLDGRLFLIEKDGYQTETIKAVYDGNLPHPLLVSNIMLYEIGEERPLPVEETVEEIDTLESETE